MRHEVLISTSDGRRSIVIDDDFCQSLGVPQGVNIETVSLFLSSWITLLADSPLNSSRKPFRLFKAFLRRIALEGLKGIVVRFSDLAHQLVSQHLLMGSATSIGDWISDFKDTPVFFEYNHYFKTGDIETLRYLYTFLNFGKKLDYVDETFNEVAFRNWLDIEKRLSDQCFDDVDICALSRIMSSILPVFSWSDLRPKFGPGSVQERGVRGRIDKLRSLRFDPIIDRFLLHGHIGKYGCGEESGVHKSKIIPDPDSWTPARGVSDRISRLRFVPKNLKTSRSICMEPNTLMYFQQAVSREFMSLIGDSSMSRFIDIKDQTRNQDLAYIGSYTSEIDTLDLSSASDSLSYELVKRVFPPSWQIPMRATRSHSVILPDGKLFPIKKFAPMGSALCFPTQCILFASVCIYAACLYTYEVSGARQGFLDWLSTDTIRWVVGKFADDLTYSRNRFQPLAVYGDDICVDRRLTDIVKSILARLGFTVNHEKSFCGSQSFRESCGKFFLEGHDITPLYFRVKGVRQKLTAEHVVSQVHLLNSCSERGYVHTYRFLHKSITTWGCHKRLKEKTSMKNSIPYVNDTRNFGILCVRSAKNSHLRTRYNEDYQRIEYHSWTISYDYKRRPGNLLSLVDAYEHMRWWASHTERDSTEESSSVSRYDTGGAGVKWRWIPLY